MSKLLFFISTVFLCLATTHSAFAGDCSVRRGVSDPTQIIADGKIVNAGPMALEVCVPTRSNVWVLQKMRSANIPELYGKRCSFIEALFTPIQPQDVYNGYCADADFPLIAEEEAMLATDMDQERLYLGIRDPEQRLSWRIYEINVPL